MEEMDLRGPLESSVLEPSFFVDLHEPQAPSHQHFPPTVPEDALHTITIPERFKQWLFDVAHSHADGALPPDIAYVAQLICGPLSMLSVSSNAMPCGAHIPQPYGTLTSPTVAGPSDFHVPAGQDAPHAESRPSDLGDVASYGGYPTPRSVEDEIGSEGGETVGCEWADCRALLSSSTEKRVRDHLREVHFGHRWDSERKERCRWNGCEKVMLARSLPKHIRTVHLKVMEVSCSVPGCNSTFTRGDAKKRHVDQVHHGIVPVVEQVWPLENK
ncbi:uncharacterized protein LAESUDRAFT_426134 [Laetiporus sulphureus 93-53]|uniref:C2H2-type domain-containing protein n=1 Tax=Laetiporus sulphureus 93-53 TaxID=1314785 RepID=A0A165GJX2_9APHY|nr:uncharacterized protein LAESUDRAFT_426134 [Laetiporus sulphureus 93-53]KZT10455.1 hypothetical protein LAESUDRAFT_426134 [Laetiporus sulphureus 93-53]